MEVGGAGIEGTEDGDHGEKRLYFIFAQLSFLPVFDQSIAVQIG
jgi:hypothetical protein